MSDAVQASFYRFLQDGVADAELSLRRPGAFPYTVLFAPSWMYRSHPETGADFAYQRRVLDRLGVVNRLIASRQAAPVEENAARSAATVPMTVQCCWQTPCGPAASTSLSSGPTISSRPGRTTPTASPCCGRSPWPSNSTVSLRSPQPWLARGRAWRSGSTKTALAARDRQSTTRPFRARVTTRSGQRGLPPTLQLAFDQRVDVRVGVDRQRIVHRQSTRIDRRPVDAVDLPPHQP